MKKSDFLDRLDLLQQQQQQLKEQFAANINAFNGAMQECNYWISILPDEESEVVSLEAPAVDVAEGPLES